ncbi:flagella basal body P-ring formation protein FlgA [uncultured Brevundimonas sp.]|uniref:flagella basal body P-ring formation protein FlgA n=1 Tax=uncultured Brevundimonas sp. TaxID=213418 RepID=UPI0026004B20|nr:flagella basal body P-ring formation protein FlgA [uncultured Brevundimonas sp.]
MRALILGAALALAVAGSAFAGPVTLKSNPVDSDGQVTFGDLFDGAGAASGVVVGRRVGPSIVFEAGQLQSLARQSGLDWANPTGLRRVVVRHAAEAPTEPATVLPIASPTTAAAPTYAPARAGYVDRVINRNDLVEVAFESGGIRLTVTGRAQRHAAVGEPVAVLNLQSGRTIDAVATGPGRAIAGPAAQSARTNQFAAR